MNTTTLLAFSNELADAVAAIEPAIVQVQGRRRPATGIAFAPDLIVTTTTSASGTTQYGFRLGNGAIVPLTSDAKGNVSAHVAPGVIPDLMNPFYGEHGPQTTLSAIDVQILRLRRKIERDAANPAYILTEHRVGYRFEKQTISPPRTV